MAGRARTACRSLRRGPRRGRPRLGEPICPECFDYEHAVLWNALAPELWRRHGDPAPARARAPARRQAEASSRVRVSYVKVAEFQRRGALHFHCVLRLDGIDEDGELEAPPAQVHGAQLLIDAATGAAAARVGPLPAPRATTPDRRRRDPLGRAGRGARSSTRAAPKRRRARATSPSTRPSPPRRSAG